MRHADSHPRRIVWFYTIAAAVVALDQLTKLAARQYLSFDQPRTVIPGFFDLKLSYNSGAAFGIMPNWAPLFIIAGLVAVFAIVRLRRAGASSPALSVGLGLLLGGAIGNLIDRLASPSGEVTDFLSLHLTLGDRIYAWPTFNVADIAIVCGIAAVFFYVYVIEKRRAERRED